MKFLFFDTETTGLPKDRKIPAEKQKDNWADIVSISWMLFENEKMITKASHIVKPGAWIIPEESTKIHGISHYLAVQTGSPLVDVLEQFTRDLHLADYVVAHNFDFDMNVVNGAIWWRLGISEIPVWSNPICTAKYGKDLTRIESQNKFGKYFRFPKLSELYAHVMKKEASISLHNSLHDTIILAELFFHLPIYKTIIGKDVANIQSPPTGRLRVTFSATE